MSVISFSFVSIFIATLECMEETREFVIIAALKAKCHIGA